MHAAPFFSYELATSTCFKCDIKWPNVETSPQTISTVLSMAVSFKKLTCEIIDFQINMRKDLASTKIWHYGLKNLSCE